MIKFIKTKILQIIYIILFILLAYFLYKTNLYKMIHKLPCLSVSLSIIVLAFILYTKNTHISFDKNTKNITIIISLTILFLLMLPITDLIKVFLIELNIQSIFIWLYYIIILVISINICLIKIFELKIKENNAKNLKTTVIVINIINLALLLIYALSTTTGYYDYDFKFIWNTPLVYLTNWHTYAYTMLIYFSRTIFHTPYVTIIIQSLLWLIALNYSLKILARETKNTRIIIVFSIIQIFLLTGFKQNVFLWKDIIFTISFYMIILSIIDCITNKKINKKNIVIFIIFGINVCNFRHGGWLLIFIVTTLIVFLLRKNKTIIKKILLCGVITISSYFIFDTICDYLLKGYQTPNNIKHTVPIYQIAYFMNNDYNFSEKNIEYLEKLYPIEIWKENFVLNDGDSVSRGWRIPNEYEDNLINFDYSNILPINLEIFTDKPIRYVKSLLNLNNLIWKITDIDSNTEMYTLHSNNQFNDNEFFSTTTETLYCENEDNLTFTKNDFFYNLVNKIEHFLFNNSLFFDIKSRGGFSLYILILSTILFLYKKEKKYLLAVFPLFIWALLLSISIPRSLTRYVIIFIISWPIIFLLALSKKITKK